MTQLPPSMRTKRRYIQIQGGSRESIEGILLLHLGTFGWAKAEPLFVTVPEIDGIVLSVDRAALDNVRAALELSKEKMIITRVSGTIKGLRA